MDEVEGDQLDICLFLGWVLGVSFVYFLDEVKELSKWRCLYKGSGRLGGFGSVHVPRNPENL